jgi:CheY-like chemotaxis protein
MYHAFSTVNQGSKGSGGVPLLEGTWHMASQTVVVVIDDLFFLVKVRTTLQHFGLTAEVLTTGTAVQDYVCTASTPALVIVDLTLRADDPIAVIRTLRAIDGSEGIPILAFGAHVAVDLRRQALEVGADQVVTKAEFSQHLPDFIQHFISRTTTSD